MWRVRLVVPAVAVGAVCAVLAVTAAGGGAARQGTVRHGPATDPFLVWGSLDASGGPRAVVDAYPGGSSMHWSVCRPVGQGTCVAVLTRGGIAQPGPQPAGTVFRLAATDGGRLYHSSLIWDGPLHLIAAPDLRGLAHFGAEISVVGGRWDGGWRGESGQLGIEACPSTRATRCVTLSGEELECNLSGVCWSRGSVPHTAADRARIGNWYTGWYLFALDAHVVDPISALLGYASEAAIAPWRTSRAVARSAPYGPITGPPPPRVRILSHARRVGGRIILASVYCSVHCHVWLSAWRVHPSANQPDGASADAHLSGHAEVGITAWLAPGRLRVTVKVGDGPYVSGRSLLR